MKAFYLDLYGSSKSKLLPTIFFSDYRFMLAYFIILFFFRKNSLKAVNQNGRVVPLSTHQVSTHCRHIIDTLGKFKQCRNFFLSLKISLRCSHLTTMFINKILKLLYLTFITVIILFIHIVILLVTFQLVLTHLTFTSSKSTIVTLGKAVK